MQVQADFPYAAASATPVKSATCRSFRWEPCPAETAVASKAYLSLEAFERREKQMEEAGLPKPRRCFVPQSW